MNLKQIVEQINRQLTISDSYPEKRLLKIIENDDQLIYSEDGFDHFLIPIDDEESDEQERLDGLFVSISRNVLERDKTKKFLIIKTQSSRREMFVPFISELISKDLSNPVESLNETLTEWSNFWAGKRARLSKHEQVGLIGELISLSMLIKYSGLKIIDKWGGPLDWLHDFESEKIDLEIKTTTKQPDTVYISKISQVAPMEGSKELHLVVIGLEQGEEFSLPDLVEQTRTQLLNSAKRNQFEKVLKRSGYRDTEKHYYSKTYSMAFIKSHQITENSPVLKPSLLGEIPQTIGDIKYNLLTHALDTVEVDDTKWLEFGKMM